MSHLSLSPCPCSRLQLASSSRHWCLHIEQPQASTHLLPLTDDNLHPSRSLRSAGERRLVVPLQRGTKNVPGWWNEFPTPIRNVESLPVFKRHLKTHLFRLHLTSSKKKKTLLTLQKHVLQALPVSVCLFIMYCLLYSSIVSRFG